jgi:hypothetical protein
MSLGLSIIPVKKYYDCGGGKKAILNYTKLTFDQDYQIFEQISNFAGGNNSVIPTLPLPQEVTLYLDGKDIRTNPYGDELTVALAGDMQKIKWPENTHPFNNAIKAFIDSLPAETHIILYWE